MSRDFGWHVASPLERLLGAQGEWDLDEEELGALEHNWVAQPSSAGKTKHAEMAVDVQDVGSPSSGL